MYKSSVFLFLCQKGILPCFLDKRTEEHIELKVNS